MYITHSSRKLQILNLLHNGSTARHQLSTDGFAPYPDAVQKAFHQAADYGVIIKKFTPDLVGPGRNGPPGMTGSSRRVICGTFHRKEICTAHVERNNLTIRTFIRRYTRLSLGFSKKVENLIAAVGLHLAYYNFCWVHKAHRMTPAMAAGLTEEVWSLERLAEEAELFERRREFVWDQFER